jgi:hypothetical protein
MKIIISIVLTFIIFLYSCTDTGKPAKHVSAEDSIAKQKFFPVTDYIRGQIYDIKKSGVNPLKYLIADGHTDSVWIKIEELDKEVAEFLRPEIDSANLTALFSEKSFLDQSLGAVTFTYDAAGVLPDSMKLKHWDVYIDPKTNKVKRVYMVKEIDKSKTLQLTWLGSQWCKITTIATDANGVMKVEKEEKLIWDF